MSKSTSTAVQSAEGWQSLDSASRAESPIWRRAEFVLPILLLFLHGAYYNPIGDLAGLRGVDFGPLLNTPLDTVIPFSVIFIIPYTALWFLPIFMMVHLIRQPDFSVAKLRRITLGFVALILVCYVFWIAFPTCSSAGRVDDATLLQYGWMGKFTLLTYQNASIWNSFPSFHVAAPWLICRILKLYTGRVPWYVWGTTLAIFMATLGIRIHYFLDIPGGIIVAETIYRLVVVRMEKRQVVETISSRKMVGLYTCGIVAAIGILCVIITM